VCERESTPHITVRDTAVRDTAVRDIAVRDIAVRVTEAHVAVRAPA